MKKVLITIYILAFPIESFQFKQKYKPIRQREKLTRGYSLLKPFQNGFLIFKLETRKSRFAKSSSYHYKRR